MPATFTALQTDIERASADLILLKCAGQLHGADKAIAGHLISTKLCEARQLELAPDDYVIIETKGILPAPRVLFLGTPPLHLFGYEQMESFAHRAAQIIAGQRGQVRRLATTIHGTGYGLDAQEALLSLVKGFKNGLAVAPIPGLQEIVFCERNPRFAKGLASALANLPTAPLAAAQTKNPAARTLPESAPQPTGKTSADEIAGTCPPKAASEKPHIFVAMPFSEDFEDIYEFGIYAPVRKCGFICEKTSESHFTGDIMRRVQEKIETAYMVIAEMSGARPNVYLEVGYAWGKGIPVIMVARRGENLHFDVSRHRCLFYDSIRQLSRDLEGLLTGLSARDLTLL